MDNENQSSGTGEGSLLDACRKAGIRPTPQRMEIYAELARSREHPSAERVHRRVRRRMPSLSLDTVYRTLRLFEERGLATRISTNGDRSRFDGNAQPHHHFICKRCGAIHDVHAPPLSGLQPPDGLDNLGRVEGVRVEFWGVCAACAAKGS